MSKTPGWDKFDEWNMRTFNKWLDGGPAPDPREHIYGPRKPKTEFDVYGQPIKSPKEEYIEAFKQQEKKRRKGFDDFIKHYRNWPGSLDDLLREFPHYEQYLAPIPNMYEDRLRDLGF
jgi:hypothetical protein